MSLLYKLLLFEIGNGGRTEGSGMFSDSPHDKDQLKESFFIPYGISNLLLEKVDGKFILSKVW